MTQFVRGALTRARKAGARIIFVTCDPGTELQTFVDLTIAPGVGAEVIAGSTRLKAGTATKLVLNMLTTGAMVRIGKTYGNLMVDVQTGSEKLKDRARRIVNIVTGLDYDDADELLKRAHWNVKAAIVMQKTALPYLKALSRLRKAHDSMREAIGEDIEPRLRGMLQGHAEAVVVRDGASHTGRRSATAERHAPRPPRRRRGRVRRGRARRRLRRARRSTSQARPDVSSAAAARSRYSSTSRCVCRNDAGRRVVSGPRSVRSIHPALRSPVAISTIRRARRIVAIPIDSASRGTTSTFPPNSAAFSRRVTSCSLTRCVRAASSSPGSLNPMWPLAPMPRTWRSMPPAASIAAS